MKADKDLLSPNRLDVPTDRLAVIDMKHQEIDALGNHTRGNNNDYDALIAVVDYLMERRRRRLATEQKGHGHKDSGSNEPQHNK